MKSAKILLVYASKYGQTQKISERLAQQLSARGPDVELMPAQDLKEIDFSEYHAVLVGSPLYAGQMDRRIKQWCLSHREALSKVPNAFFSVSLNAADKRPEARIADQQMIDKFIAQSQWTPRMTKSFKGALWYTKYNFLLRYWMKRISKEAGGPLDTSRDYEMTDWADVDSFAVSFFRQVAESRASARALQQKAF